MGRRDGELVKRRLGLKIASLSSARAPWPLSTSMKNDLPGHVHVHARCLYSLSALSRCTFHTETNVVLADSALFLVPGDFCPVSGVGPLPSSSRHAARLPCFAYCISKSSRLPSQPSPAECLALPLLPPRPPSVPLVLAPGSCWLYVATYCFHVCFLTETVSSWRSGTASF